MRLQNLPKQVVIGDAGISPRVPVGEDDAQHSWLHSFARAPALDRRGPAPV